MSEQIGRPARGYSWPPFEKGNPIGAETRFAEGNTEQMTHGAWSERSWRPVADQLAAELPAVAPWATDPSAAAAVAAWARAEARLRLVAAWLDEHGDLDENGTPRAATNLMAQLETTAAKARDSLGLTPMSLATLLGKLAAVATAGGDGHGLDQLKAAGARILEARQQHGLNAGENDAGEPADNEMEHDRG